MKKYITSNNIYDFYYLWYLWNQDRSMFSTSSYAKEILDYYLEDIKKRYVISFRQLLRDQVQKYIDRNRVDRDIRDMELSIDINLSTLKDLMAKTFRSDMKRRNERWDFIAEWAYNLSRINDPGSIFIAIDRLNNAIHNTETHVLDKFPNANELLTALNFCADIKDPRGLRNKASKDIRDLI